MYRCSTCHEAWHDENARRNKYICWPDCGGRLALVPPLALPNLEGCGFGKLPYPLALTADRLAKAMHSSSDNLRSLFLLKDCFEAAIKYFAAILLAEYRLLPHLCIPERNKQLLEGLVKPSLGDWVNEVVRPLSFWLFDEPAPLGKKVAALFVMRPNPRAKPAVSALWKSCYAFVPYRNDAIGHGAQRADSHYEEKLREYLPLVRQLLDGVLYLGDWRLCLVTAVDGCEIWMGTQLKPDPETCRFSPREIGHFVLRGPGGTYLDLYPFLSYLFDDSKSERRRLHYYDWLDSYKPSKKKAGVLEYDNGFRYARIEPIGGFEETFTAKMLEEAFNRFRGRMEVIEGRVANFSELIESHAAIVGRSRVIKRVRGFVKDHDRGLLMIVAQPGKGKTALMAHLIEEVFDNYSPKPVHFFYRATAGIDEPVVCVRSLYYSLLEAHGMTEAEESKQQNSAGEVFNKLTNLLKVNLKSRLTPDRPQLIFIDAVDEARSDGDDRAFRLIPVDLPENVYVIAATRPVPGREVLRNRAQVEWYELDSLDWKDEDEKDGREYVQRELQGIALSEQIQREIVRVSDRNFLVLKLLCERVRNNPLPSAVAKLLHQMATASGPEKLTPIYEEYWLRLKARCSPEQVTQLSNVAGALMTAKEPLTKGVLCKVLNLLEGDWDLAMSHLGGYLTQGTAKEESVAETFYRIYHESFANFLRNKLKDHRQRYLEYLIQFCLSWEELPEGQGKKYALKYGVRHVLDVPQIGARQFERMRQLLEGEFLDEKAKHVGFAEALDDTKRMADVLAKAGEEQWDLFRASAYRHCKLMEEWRGGPSELEKMIAKGEFDRVGKLLDRDEDFFRKGLLMNALGSLAGEQGWPLAAEAESQGAVYMASQLAAVTESAKRYSRETTALALARLIQVERVLPALQLISSPLTTNESSGAEPPGPEWMWTALGRGRELIWFLWFFTVCGLIVYTAYAHSGAALLAVLAVWACYSWVASRALKRKYAALLRKYRLWMETQSDEELLTSLSQALDLLYWEVPSSWKEEIAAILQRGFPRLADRPAQAAQIALKVASLTWPKVNRLEFVGGRWQANQTIDWWPAGQIVIRAMNRLNEEHREAIRTELYSLLGKRRPSHNLLRLLAETSGQNSQTEPFLDTMANYVPDKADWTRFEESVKNVRELIAFSLYRAPGLFLARTALTSLRRDEASKSASRTSKWPLQRVFGFVQQLFLLRRHGLCGLAQILEGTAADKRETLSDCIYPFTESDARRLRPLRDTLVAQAILRGHHVIRVKLATKKVYKRVLGKLLKRRYLNQADMALKVMDDRDLLDVTMKQKIVPPDDKSLSPIDASEDEGQLRRALPLQPVWWSWLLTAGIGSLIAVLCLALLAAFSDRPTKSWLLTWGLVDAIGLCLGFATFQHLFSFVQSGQATPRFLNSHSTGPMQLLLLPLRWLVGWLQKQDNLLDNRRGRRVVASLIVIWLLAQTHSGICSRFTLADFHQQSVFVFDDGRLPPFHLLLVFISLLAVNLLTPEFIALWRGSWLLYPTRRQLKWVRMAGAAAVVVMCLTCIALFV